MLHDRLERARRVIGGDRLARHHEVELVDGVVMSADIVEALCRFRIIVEGDAGRDDVDKGGTLVLDRRLDQRYQLRLVSGEAAGDERGAELQGEGDQVDRRVGVDGATPRLRTLVGSRRELAFGQAVYTVVLDDVDHVDGAANAVRE